MRRNHINYAVRLLALCAGLMIISCDLLITPIKARTNPNDPNTTIQPATDLSLSLQAEGDAWGYGSTGDGITRVRTLMSRGF